MENIIKINTSNLELSYNDIQNGDLGSHFLINTSLVSSIPSILGKNNNTSHLNNNSSYYDLSVNINNTDYVQKELKPILNIEPILSRTINPNPDGTKGEKGIYNVVKDSQNNVYVAGWYISTGGPCPIFNLDGTTSNFSLPKTILVRQNLNNMLIDRSAPSHFIIKYNTLGQAISWTQLPSRRLGENTSDTGINGLPEGLDNINYFDDFRPMGNLLCDSSDNLYFGALVIHSSVRCPVHHFTTTNTLTEASFTLPITGDTVRESATFTIIKYSSNGTANSWTQLRIVRVGHTTQGYDMKLDSNNNLYATGAYFMTYNSNIPNVTFRNFSTTNTEGSIIATLPQPTTQQRRYFFLKWDSSGNAQKWTSIVATTTATQSFGYGIYIDSLNNKYVTGYYSDSNNIQLYNMTTDPSNVGLPVFTIPGTSSRTTTLLLKYDNNDNIVAWSSMVSTATSSSIGYSIIGDSDNNIYVTGFYNSSTSNIRINNFSTSNSAGTTIYTLPSTLNNDIFIAKWNSDGNAIARTTLSGSNLDAGIKLIIDTSNNLYITGVYNSNSSVSIKNLTNAASITSSSMSLPSTDNQSAFIVKYNSNGNVNSWTNIDSIGNGSGFDVGYSILLDNSNNLYIAGIFSNSIVPIRNFSSDNKYNDIAFNIYGDPRFYNPLFVKYNSLGEAINAINIVPNTISKIYGENSDSSLDLLGIGTRFYNNSSNLLSYTISNLNETRSKYHTLLFNSYNTTQDISVNLLYFDTNNNIDTETIVITNDVSSNNYMYSLKKNVKYDKLKIDLLENIQYNFKLVGILKTPNKLNSSLDIINISDTLNTWGLIDTNIENNWQSICWSSELNLFCAVGLLGSTIMTSPDGINWTSRNSGINKSLHGICWSKELSLFCAVGDSIIITSPNGINWTNILVPANNIWRNICWSPELNIFCAVSSTGAGNRVMTSSNGINWTLRNTNNNNWFSVCWSSELNLFCAVSITGSGNRVMISSDGITWTTQNTLDSLWSSICWSSELNLFCAVSSSGNNECIMTSVNGINWTNRTIESTNQWNSISWSPEFGCFCAVSSTGTQGRIMTSINGINWVDYNSTPLSIWNNCCWSPKLFKFCAVSGTGKTMTNIISSLTETEEVVSIVSPSDSNFILEQVKNISSLNINTESITTTITTNLITRSIENLSQEDKKNVRDETIKTIFETFTNLESFKTTGSNLLLKETIPLISDFSNQKLDEVFIVNPSLVTEINVNNFITSKNVAIFIPIEQTANAEFTLNLKNNKILYLTNNNNNTYDLSGVVTRTVQKGDTIFIDDYFITFGSIFIGELPSINFNLSVFNSNVVLDVCGNMFGETPIQIDSSVNAIIEVSLDTMKEMFKYQVDASDINNLSSSDIKYFVNSSLFSNRNPADAMLDPNDITRWIASSGTSGEYLLGKLFVCHDFIRYLAVKLFNTYHAVDLFNNEEELLSSIRSKCLNETLANIQSKLQAVDICNNQLDDYIDISGVRFYYKTNSDISPNNICRVLFNQLVYSNKTRFSTIQNTDLPQSLPFQENDIINFKLTLLPSSDQHLLTDVAKFEGRSYKIQYKMVTNPNNISIID